MAPVSPAATALATPASAAEPAPRRLKVGLFVDARRQPDWLAEAFARVAASDFAEIALIAETGPAVARASAHAPPGWRLYDRLDRWAFARDADPAAPSDLPQRVPHGAFVARGAAGPGFAAGAMPDLDVAFALGDVDDAALDGLARYGVWRFHFHAGDGEALAGFREVAQNAPLSGSALKVRLVPRGVERFAYQSWSRTYPYSPARNREQLLRKTAEFALRALRELHRSGVEWLEQCAPVREAQGAVPLRFGRGLAAIGARLARRGVEKALNVEQWFLAYRINNPQIGGSEGSVPGDLRGFTRLVPPKDRYWADPFALERNGRYYVFFEELPFRTGRAHISMLEIDAQGRASEPVRVLERDYHLSYPFLTEHDGQLYMIPETAQAGTLEVYRCIDFPRRWKLERVLMNDVRFVDATFHRGADRWWMFANAAPTGSRVFDDELHLFHAPGLLGDWQPHRRNPVKSDVRGSRPAGRLFWRNGSLYRPAQICAPLYGSGLALNRVLRLTPHDYAERQVERVLPSGGLLGLHTFNRAGDLTVVDAFARRSRFQ
jgi:hypothetical protein